MQRGKGASEPGKVGEVLITAAWLNAMLGVEVNSGKVQKFGNKLLKMAKQFVGLEYLNLSEARIKEIGFEGMLKPIKISCSDHEGARDGRVQQWDRQGLESHLRLVHGQPIRHRRSSIVVSAKYAADKKIQPRDCSKES